MLAISICFFFFNDTATTEIYTLSLHDALPISLLAYSSKWMLFWAQNISKMRTTRSEEHTSELQSRLHLVCRLLLEKKKKNIITYNVDHQLRVTSFHDHTKSV